MIDDQLAVSDRIMVISKHADLIHAVWHQEDQIIAVWLSSMPPSSGHLSAHYHLAAVSSRQAGPSVWADLWWLENTRWITAHQLKCRPLTHFPLQHVFGFFSGQIHLHDIGFQRSHWNCALPPWCSSFITVYGTFCPLWSTNEKKN